MQPTHAKRADTGFTLLEIVLSIMLMGVLASVAGLFMVSGVKGFVLSRQNTALSQKANLALGRMTRELTTQMADVLSLTGSGGGTIGVSYENAAGTRRNLLLTGSGARKTLMLNTGTTLPTAASNEILIDNVNSLDMDFRTAAGGAWTTSDDFADLSLVDITLTLYLNDADADTMTFTTAANPRNNLTLNGPYE